MIEPICVSSLQLREERVSFRCEQTYVVNGSDRMSNEDVQNEFADRDDSSEMLVLMSRE